MKRKRHSTAEVAAKLHEADELIQHGASQAEIARRLGISVMTFHRWRKLRRTRIEEVPLVPADQVDSPDTDLRSRVVELEVENARLRQLVTDLLLKKIKL